MPRTMRKNRADKGNTQVQSPENQENTHQYHRKRDKFSHVLSYACADETTGKAQQQQGGQRSYPEE